MDERGSLGAFLAGFIIGGLIGAAVALLMAPQSGEETRIYIREKGIELKDKASESVEMAKERAEALAQKSSEAIEAGKAKVQGAVGTAQKKPTDGNEEAPAV